MLTNKTSRWAYFKCDECGKRWYISIADMDKHINEKTCKKCSIKEPLEINKWFIEKFYSK